MSDASVVIDALTVRYGDRTAVDAVSWSAEAGRITAVLGPNGAGKTSTIETAEGYRRPTSGSVRVLGLDPISQAKTLAPRMGLMLQRNGVYLTMRPRETLRLFAAYYGSRAVDPDELLDRVGLGAVASTPWRRLSGGEQQRLSLALALVGRPEVVFLDEPTAMIDPAATVSVRSLIGSLRDDGVCVVMTTHDLDDAERLADHVVIMDGGRIVANGSPAELTAARADDGIEFEPLSNGAEDDLLAGLAADLHVNVERRGAAIHVDLSPTPANLAAVTAALAKRGVSVGAMRSARRSLEDVFLKLTAQSQTTTEVTPSGVRGRRRGRR